MIRARFFSAVDYRPVSWPIKHPYWWAGMSGDRYVVVAYADSEEQILELWPEAENLDYEECDDYTFTSIFSKPRWLE